VIDAAIIERLNRGYLRAIKERNEQ